MVKRAIKKWKSFSIDVRANLLFLAALFLVPVVTFGILALLAVQPAVPAHVTIAGVVRPDVTVFGSRDGRTIVLFDRGAAYEVDLESKLLSVGSSRPVRIAFGRYLVEGPTAMLVSTGLGGKSEHEPSLEVSTDVVSFLTREGEVVLIELD